MIFALRYGGDEFVVVFSKATLNEANIVFSSIQEKINKFNLSDKKYKIEISYGFAEYFPESNFSAEDLIKTADENMYKMKKKLPLLKF